MFAFVDAGNAFRPSMNDPIVVGTGAGVEWITKLGPIKVALAKPLSKDSNAWRVHASFGPEL
ncbi:Translocation and assembly module TamA precursor [compost metagenome]